MSFPDHPARFRSDSRVEDEARAVRKWGNLNGSLQFNVVDLIEGPLQRHLPFSLDIKFFEKRRDKVPAYVKFLRGKDHAELHVEQKVWKLAELNYNASRFILCHEIGHLKMHRNDALGFAKLNTSRFSNLQPEDLAEPQANKFADNILVPTELVDNTWDAQEIANHFNVPNDCAQRRFDQLQDTRRRRMAKSYAGEACERCHNFTLLRIGTYCRCDTCEQQSGPF